MALTILPTSQNGVVAPSRALTRPSPHILIANTLTSYFTQGIWLKSINTAEYPKQVPVTFYTTANDGGNITTATLGTAYYKGVTATLFATALPTGTNYISATWPGESRWAGFTTTMTSTVIVSPGYPLGGKMLMVESPISGYAVMTETNVTIVASLTTSTTVNTGTVLFFDGSTLIGSQPISNNSASFQTIFYTSGTHALSAIWNGGLWGGKFYQRQSTSTNYIVSDHATLTNFTVSVSPNPTAIYASPYTIVANANTTTQIAGSVTFYNGTTTINTVVLTANTATLVLPSTYFAFGTWTITATYSGSDIVPKYFPATSSTYLTVSNPKSTFTDLYLSTNSVGHTTTLATATIFVESSGDYTLDKTVTLEDDLGVVLGTSTVTSVSQSIDPLWTATVCALSLGTWTQVTLYRSDGTAYPPGYAIPDLTRTRNTSTTITSDPYAFTWSLGSGPHVGYEGLTAGINPSDLTIDFYNRTISYPYTISPERWTYSISPFDPSPPNSNNDFYNFGTNDYTIDFWVKNSGNIVSVPTNGIAYPLGRTNAPTWGMQTGPGAMAIEVLPIGVYDQKNQYVDIPAVPSTVLGVTGDVIIRVYNNNLDSYGRQATWQNLSNQELANVVNAPGYQPQPIINVTVSNLDNWSHLAIVRHNSITSLYVNGQKITSVNDTYNYGPGGRPDLADPPPDYKPTFSPPHYLNMDQFRITRAARFTHNFRPQNWILHDQSMTGVGQAVITWNPTVESTGDRILTATYNGATLTGTNFISTSTGISFTRNYY